MIMQNLKNKKFFFLSGFLLFLLFFIIYWIQIKNSIGDIPLHIASSMKLTGYSINKYVFTIILDISNGSLIGIAVFLAIVSLLTVIAVYNLLKTINMFCNDKLNCEKCWIVSCLIPFFYSIYIPYLYPYFYACTISPNAWHNSTLIEMRLFAIVSFVFFIKMYYSEQIKLKDWCGFTVSLLVSNAFKPNYMIGFVPVALAYLLLLVIRDNKTFVKCLYIGLGIMVSAFPLIYQYIELYCDPKKGEGGLEIVFGGRLIQSGNPWYKVICGLSFVLCYALYEIVDYLKKTKELDVWKSVVFFTYCMAIVNLLMYCFLLEKNDRGHGNTAWGLKNALFIVYAVDIYGVCRVFKKNRIHALLLSIIPICQLISGIVYTILLIIRKDYYI